MRLKDLIPSAKWLIEYYDYWLRVANVASRSEINWDYANVARLQPADLTRAMISLDLRKAVIEGKESDNLPLQPGDIVTIFTKGDFQVSRAESTSLVRLEGEFKHPGVYQVKGGETLRQIIERAGGLTPGAYLFGAEFTRESTRIQQERNYQEALNRIETEAEADAAVSSRSVLSPEDAQALSAQLAARRAIIARLRQLRPTGRIALKIPEQATAADLPELPLEDGDRLYVPPQPSMVNIFGAVFSDVSLLYEPDKNAYDYIAEAGGVTKRADKSQIFVLRPNGRVVGTQRWFFGLFTSLPISNLMPGDTIVVPEDYDRTTFTRSLKDWTQILYQFGLGVAAIKILRQ
jgi:protein involved in polysaccharide export with SLBB domain